MTDQVNLCTGCNTMKHLDASGLCGRCDADNAMAGELQERTDAILIAVAEQAFNIRSGHETEDLSVIMTQAHDQLIALFAAERTRLLEDMEIEHTKELEACIASTRQDLLESLQREMPEKRTIDNDHDYTDNTFNKGVNHAIQEVNQLLTNYVQGGE